MLKSIDNNTWVTCISQATKNDLCNYLPSLNPSKVFVTHLAASDVFQKHSDPETTIAVRNRYNIPVHSPYVLSVCTLEPRKNIDHTIRCFVELIKEQKIKDLHLVLTGTVGWDYDKIFDELSSTPGMKNKIILTGYVPDEDLSVLYSDALVFVYPSFYEGFGLPPLEAMKCGVPVITSNTSSLPEVVGNAGITLDPKYSDGLTQSLLELYSKPSLRKEMSLKSISQAQNFSWEKCTSETLSAYKKARG